MAKQPPDKITTEQIDGFNIMPEARGSCACVGCRRRGRVKMFYSIDDGQTFYFICFEHAIEFANHILTHYKFGG